MKNQKQRRFKKGELKSLVEKYLLEIFEHSIKSKNIEMLSMKNIVRYIISRIQQATNDRIKVSEGSVRKILHRLFGEKYREYKNTREPMGISISGKKLRLYIYSIGKEAYLIPEELHEEFLKRYKDKIGFESKLLKYFENKIKSIIRSPTKDNIRELENIIVILYDLFKEQEYKTIVSCIIKKYGENIIEALFGNLEKMKNVHDTLISIMRLYYEITRSKSYYFLDRMIKMAFSENTDISTAKTLLTVVMEILDKFKVIDFKELILNNKDLIIENASRLPDIFKGSSDLKRKMMEAIAKEFSKKDRESIAIVFFDKGEYEIGKMILGGEIK